MRKVLTSQACRSMFLPIRDDFFSILEKRREKNSRSTSKGKQKERLPRGEQEEWSLAPRCSSGTHSGCSSSRWAAAPAGAQPAARLPVKGLLATSKNPAPTLAPNAASPLASGRERVDVGKGIRRLRNWDGVPSRVRAWGNTQRKPKWAAGFRLPVPA